VAKLFVEAGVVVLCSFISPFRAERQMARELLAEGEFIEVFVDTDLEACIARDPKGLYAKALKGEIANFTGVSSPYEQPDDAEIVLKTAEAPADVLASRVVDDLVKRGIV
jgi:bifunctional enzyme CysN/CysC